MNAIACPPTLLLLLLPFCFVLTCLQVQVRAQQQPGMQQARAPHGLAYENPVSFSPSAFQFFHPSSDAPYAAPPPSLSSVASSEARVQERIWASPEGNKGDRVGAGGTVAILLALVLIVLVVMGAYHVFIRRPARTKRDIDVKPEA